MINNKGFSFVEILISIFFISIVIVPFFSYFTIVTREGYLLRVKNNAVLFASDVLESYVPGSFVGSKEYDRDIYHIREKVNQKSNYDEVVVVVEYQTESGRSNVKLSKYYEAK